MSLIKVHSFDFDCRGDDSNEVNAFFILFYSSTSRSRTGCGTIGVRMRPVLGASGRRGRRARVPAAAASPRRAASACKGRPFDASEFLTIFFSSLTVCVLQLS